MVGISKPHPEIFLKASAMANCAPEDIIFIGDNFHYDGAGAINAGMQAIHFNVGLLHQARMAMGELKRGIRTTLLPTSDVLCIDRLSELVPLLGIQNHAPKQARPDAQMH
jgi:FMN phosphatase YigB (HAD superfamily)